MNHNLNLQRTKQNMPLDMNRIRNMEIKYCLQSFPSNDTNEDKIDNIIIDIQSSELSLPIPNNVLL